MKFTERRESNERDGELREEEIESDREAIGMSLRVYQVREEMRRLIRNSNYQE